MGHPAVSYPPSAFSFEIAATREGHALVVPSGFLNLNLVILSEAKNLCSPRECIGPSRKKRAQDDKALQGDRGVHRF
jgi:hypothetical protein